MIGFARELYEQRAGYPILKDTRTERWPLLATALKLGWIAYEDYAFAASLLPAPFDKDELTAAFLCHLSLAAKEGHLCVLKQPGALAPSPLNLWIGSLPASEAAPLAPLLEGLVNSEIPFPDGLVSAAGSGTPHTPVCKSGDLYYLQKYWIFERAFVQSFRELTAVPPSLPIPAAYWNAEIQTMKQLNQLNDLQAEAIGNACNHRFSIICGGPGTGKTYTSGHLIRLFWEFLTPSQQKACKIALAAPTGKAAYNLQKSLEKAFLRSSGPKPQFQAQTLHSLLEIKSSRFPPESAKKLNADLVLVDESSMIDIKIMARLFQAIKPGARLILLGDPYQLPPVEAGSAFKDIVEVLKNAPSSPVSTLKTCLRAELKEIVEFAELIQSGNLTGVLERLSTAPAHPAIQRLPGAQTGEPTHASRKNLIDHILRRLPDIPADLSDPGKILELFNQYRVLSPLRRGFFGVKELNRLIHTSRLQSIPQNSYVHCPILIVANDYNLKLFNGEVGVLIYRKRHQEGFQQGDFALFSGDEAQPYRKIPAILLPKFEYGYCMSIHKSQGSEFEDVLLLLPEGSAQFGREVFYTAATRAKKKLEIWGTDETIAHTLHRTSERLSGIH